ncbi:MAG TPA: DUF2141 domain-containing protein [Cellvibrio sp.]|nr:DUF2141 domain-containing protein [Cellvibrio sp.]
MRIGTHLVGAAALVLTLPGMAQELTVTVDNIKSAQGNLLVAVYDKAESFDANTNWVVARKIPMVEPSMVLEFKDLPAGDYAVKLFQDENQNGQIDKSSMGIPTEPYGISNNGGTFAPPSFDEAKVGVETTTRIAIHLR